MRPMYLAKSALSGMARAAGLTITSTCTLAVGLWLMGAVSMALLGARQAVQAWAQGGHISCGIAATVAEHQWPHLRAQIAALPGVREVTLLTPEQMLQQFRQRGPQEAALVEGVEASMLPAALRIVPQAALLEAQVMQDLAQRIAAVHGVEDVDYGAVPLARLRRGVRAVALGCVGLAVLLGVALTFMVMSTIRLMLYGRQDEIRILRLVGATAWFVRGPFLLEGILWGLCAGALAAAGLWGLEQALQLPLQLAAQGLHVQQPLRLFCAPLALVQMATGAAIGLLGSVLAVRAFVHEDLG